MANVNTSNLYNFLPTGSSDSVSQPSAPSDYLAPPNVGNGGQHHAVPTAPPRDRSSEIDWNKLPNEMAEKPASWNTPKVKKIAGAIFLSLGAASFGATLFAAFAFTAKPMTVISVVVGLAILTLASSITGYVVLKLKPADNDPQVLKQKRQEARLDLNDPGHKYTVDEIRQKYQESVISNHDINALIGFDAQTMSYRNFIVKHGKGVIDILDDENKTYLKLSFLKYALDPLTNRGIKEIMAMRESAVFDIQLQDVIAWNAHNEALTLSGRTYEEFIQRNGTELIAYLHADARRLLTSKFIQHIDSKGISILALQKDFKSHLQALGQSAEREIIDHIVERDQKSMHGKNGYMNFREKNGLDIIRTLCADDKGQKLKFQQAFLELSYAQLTDPKNGTDRAILDIKGDTIKETLLNRWKDTPIADLAADKEGFLASLGQEFKPGEWKDKALNDTAQMKVSEIARRLPQLFQQEILVESDCLSGGHTLRERLEEEIAEIGSFEDLIKLCANFFKFGLLSKASQKVTELASQYVLQYVNEYIQESENDIGGGCSSIITKYDLIPHALKQALDASRKEYRLEMKRKKSEIGQIQAQCQRELEEARQIKDAAIAEGKADSSLMNSQAYLKECEKNKSLTEAELQKIQKELEAFKAKASSLDKKMRSMSEELASNQRELVALFGVQNMGQIQQANQSLEQEVRRLHGEIAQLENGKNQAATYAARHPKLTTLEANIGAYEQSLKAFKIEEAGLIKLVEIRTRYESLRQQHAALSVTINSPKYASDVAELNVKIRQAAAANVTPVMGVRAAWSASAKGSQLDNLKSELADLQDKATQAASLTREMAALHPRLPGQEVGARLQFVQNQMAQITQNRNKLVNSRPAVQHEVEMLLGLPALQQRIDAAKGLLKGCEEQQKALRVRQENITAKTHQSAQLQRELSVLQKEHTNILGQLPYKQNSLGNIEGTLKLREEAYEQARNSHSMHNARLQQITLQAENAFAMAKENAERRRDQSIANELVKHRGNVEAIQKQLANL